MDQEAIISGIGLDQQPAQVQEDNSSNLERYTRDKLSVTHQIRLLENLLRGRDRKEQASQCHELMVKLAEDRFTLTVVGQFKRGKSTLMNALIGRELLPTGVLPLTSAITVVRFGPREQLVVAWQDSDLDREEPVAALNDYVTEQGNPGNRKKVRAAYVETPSPFLRRGLEFVDTPGIGSAIEANTATTLAFIPNCDAVIFVTGVEAPIAEAELDFLRKLRREVGKLFCVVNKIDLLEEPQKSQVIDFVTQQICGTLGSSHFPVYSVSSRLALAGHGGGIEKLRDALNKFLSEQRTAVLLKSVIQRALGLLAVERDNIVLAERTAVMSDDARRDRKARIRARFDAVDQKISQAIETLRKELWEAVIDPAIAQLDEQIRLGVVGLADGLATSIVPGEWETAGRFISILAHNVATAAQMEANEWLANRAQTANSKLTEITERLREETLQRVMQATAVDELISQDRRFEDFKTGLKDSVRPQLRIDSLSWVPTASALLRRMPVSLVRRRLRKWLHQAAEGFGAEVRAKAVKLVKDFLDASITDLSDGITAFVRREEERLTSSSSVSKDVFDASLAKQLEKATQIEQAFMFILESMDGESPSEVSSVERIQCREAVSPEFIPAPITRESLAQDLRVGGCAVCRHLGRVLFDFFATWQHWMVADDGAQQQYARELGFCPLHTWQLAAVSSPRGLSVGYPRLTERLRAELRTIANADASSEAVARLAANRKSCLACSTLVSVQNVCIRKLSEFLTDDASRQIYSASHGICLRHMPVFLAAVSDPATKRFIIDIAADHLKMLGEDMQSFALKQDATRRELINSNESRAVRMALEKIAGFKPLCFPWEFDEVSF